MPRAVRQAQPHIHEVRGEDMETKYAATYKFRTAVIHIDDSQCVSTPEEIEETDRNIATAAWAIIEELINRGEEL